MKITKLITLTTLVAVLAFAGEGCRKKPVRTTTLPGQGLTEVGKDNTGLTPINSGNPAGPGSGIGTLPTGPLVTPLVPPPLDTGSGFPPAAGDISRYDQDRAWGTPFTVYFDFDRAEVKGSEVSKLNEAAAKFKNAPSAAALLIEGHCDERGTPEYNRALGERRALAIREKLIGAGLSPEKIHTVTFGKDKPAAFGHDESAHSKNRRGEFILCTPPK